MVCIDRESGTGEAQATSAMSPKDTDCHNKQAIIGQIIAGNKNSLSKIPRRMWKCKLGGRRIKALVLAANPPSIKLGRVSLFSGLLKRCSWDLCWLVSPSP